jgi:predicted DNA-binding protein with PD1-like motif
MLTFKSDDGKAAMIRLEQGEDLYEGVSQGVRDLGIEAATVQVIGSLTHAKFAYYNQDRREYEEHEFPGGWEIASCLGNVSIKDGEPFLHAHLVVSGPDGKALGGHLVPGSKVFLAEVYVRALGGEAPVRKLDETLGLPVWS